MASIKAIAVPDYVYNASTSILASSVQKKVTEMPKLQANAGKSDKYALDRRIRCSLGTAKPRPRVSHRGDTLLGSILQIAQLVLQFVLLLLLGLLVDSVLNRDDLSQLLDHLIKTLEFQHLVEHAFHA